MRTGSGTPRSSDAGYTLAVLIGILAVLGIGLAAAVPHWAARVQRAKEAELVARGVQYAEAIRVFQRRFGRLPTALEELVEVEPRSIRRLWGNPFAGEGEAGWAVLMEVPGGQVVPVDPRTGAVLASAAATETDESLAGGGSPTGTAASSGIAGPIHGVRSAVRGEAYRRFFDSQEIGEWEFTVEKLAVATGAVAPSGLPRRVSYDTLGRPFPYPPPGGQPGAAAAPQSVGQGSAPSAGSGEETPPGDGGDVPEDGR